MVIAIACDHRGLDLKGTIITKLQSKGMEVLDLGTYSEESADYPVYGKMCGEAVVSGKAEKGIVICGSGIGISIAANKVKGVRCALCTDARMAEMSRKHNDANMLALGGQFTDHNVAAEIVDIWLDTEFEGGRHKRRTDMIDEM